MSALGVTRPEPSPCGFGVPRSQCHVGCGYNCRNYDRASKINGAVARLAVHLAAAAAEQTRCCGGCDLPPGHEPCGGSGSLSA